MLHQKVYTAKRWLDADNRPKAEVVIEKYELDDFTEQFIERLADHLPSIKINKTCDLDRRRDFKDLYVECMLDTKREYVKDAYLPA